MVKLLLVDLHAAAVPILILRKITSIPITHVSFWIPPSSNSVQTADSQKTNQFATLTKQHQPTESDNNKPTPYSHSPYDANSTEKTGRVDLFPGIQ